MTSADHAFDSYCVSESPEDLARVFDVCAPQLLLLANHVAGDGGVAEDLVQMTFLRAIEIAHTFDSGRPVRPWLVGILIKEAKKHRRQAGRKLNADRLTGHGGEAIPDDAAEMKEFQEALAKALDELPQAYREVLTLRLIHGLTPTEIGHARGVSPQTIKTQIRRGTDRLRRLLPASLATALVAMATTGYALPNVRETVLEAAAAASEGVVTTVAATTVAATAAAATGALSTSAAVAGPALATTAAKTAAGAGIGRTIAWLAGVGGAITLGVFAWDPFGSEPDPQPVEEREFIPEPKRGLPAIRSASEPKTVEEKRPKIDRSLITFAGRVLGDSGVGLSGILVEIVRLHPDLLVVEASGLPSCTAAPKFVAGTATTDDRGKFTIGRVKPSGLFLVVVASGTDRVDWHLVDHTPEPKAVVDLGELRLGRRKVMRGRVVDKLGFPVVGARLRHAGFPWVAGGSLGMVGAALEQVCADEFEPEGGMVVKMGRSTQVVTVPQWFRAIHDRILARSATTDENGRFEWVATRTDDLTLVVSGEGIRRKRVTMLVRGENHDVGQFVVQRLGNIRVLVRDENGDPLPDAEVMIGRFSKTATCTPIRRVGSTDASGELQAAWDEKRLVTVAVRRRVGEPWHVTEALSPTGRISIAMPRRFEVTIRVTARVGSAITPLEDTVVVRLLPGKFAPELPIGMLTMHQLGCVEPLDLAGRRTDEALGVVKIYDVPVGQWILIVSAEGHSSTALALDVDGFEHVDSQLVPLEPTVVSFDNPRFQRLSDYPVYARASEEVDRVHEFPVLIGQTDEEGAITLQRSRDRRHSVGTLSTELGACTVRAGAGVDRLSIALRQRGLIVGRVTERGEAPLTQWTVLAQSRRRVQDPPAALGVSPVFIAVRRDGTYRLPPLECGQWELRVVKLPGRMKHPSLLLPLLFPEDGLKTVKELMLESRAEETVKLEALPPEEEKPEEVEDTSPIVLRGVVRIEPQPASGLKLGVERNGRWMWYSIAGNGAFDTGIESKRPLHVAVIAGTKIPAGSPNEYLWSKSVLATRAGVGIQIALLLVDVSLTTAKKNHASGFDLTLEGVDKAGARCRMRARTDSGGWFPLSVPAGRYSLRGEHAAHGWLSRKDVAVNFPRALSFQLEALVVAAGVAVPISIDSGLWVGSKVDFVRIDAGAVKIERTVEFDRSYGFRVEGLLPGKYRVTIRPSRMLSSGAIVPPRLVKISIPQGTLQIGPGGRFGIKLTKRK